MLTVWKPILIKIGCVAVVSVLLDCALLYVQAKSGRKLPMKVRILPDLGGHV